MDLIEINHAPHHPITRTPMKKISDIRTCKYRGQQCLKKFIITHKDQVRCVKCMVESDTLQYHPLIRKPMKNIWT